MYAYYIFEENNSMHTPFQKYLLEQKAKYDTPPGFYYDPIRDQSVKGDDPFDFDDVEQKPNLGPRPEFDWEIDYVKLPRTFPAILITLFQGEKPFWMPGGMWNNLLQMVFGVFVDLPENAEDWQEYFDGVLESNGIENSASGYIKQVVAFLSDLINNGIPEGEFEVPGSDPPVTIDISDMMTEYLQWHFNQYLQQLIDFLNDYEYGG
tara:strand:- start:663 stop:1283 length:621 start_codon:yes stop_codon:yes gene_type:complete